ncbi:MAG: helix-turn-helix domain-containing protein [Acidobacteriia bacterium]|nr:helix-turn-helix domain-containing protein [Terriglobia bacterium]
MSIALLTARDVARILNVRPVTVYAAASTGRLPSVRLWKGKRRSLVRFRAEDIDAFIRNRTESQDRRVD